MLNYMLPLSMGHLATGQGCSLCRLPEEAKPEFRMALGPLGCCSFFFLMSCGFTFIKSHVLKLCLFEYMFEPLLLIFFLTSNPSTLKHYKQSECFV